MKIFPFVNTGLLGIALVISGGALTNAQSSATQPDNTKVNKRDKDPGQVTAGDQAKSGANDRDTTAKIRRSIMDDKTLSTYAHNVKIVTQNGVVTLKGPVRSQAEVDTIMSKATDIAGGGDKVVNQLSVKPKS